jgi:hypothetical protein
LLPGLQHHPRSSPDLRGTSLPRRTTSSPGRPGGPSLRLPPALSMIQRGLDTLGAQRCSLPLPCHREKREKQKHVAEHSETVIHPSIHPTTRSKAAPHLRWGSRTKFDPLPPASPPNRKRTPSLTSLFPRRCAQRWASAHKEACCFSCHLQGRGQHQGRGFVGGNTHIPFFPSLFLSIAHLPICLSLSSLPIFQHVVQPSWTVILLPLPMHA